MCIGAYDLHSAIPIVDKARACRTTRRDRRDRRDRLRGNLHCESLTFLQTSSK